VIREIQGHEVPGCGVETHESDVRATRATRPREFDAQTGRISGSFGIPSCGTAHANKTELFPWSHKPRVWGGRVDRELELADGPDGVDAFDSASGHLIPEVPERGLDVLCQDGCLGGVSCCTVLIGNDSVPEILVLFGEAELLEGAVVGVFAVVVVARKDAV
jgi:hypothetical protein